MKKKGSNIFKGAASFFKDVFFKNINRNSVGEVLIVDSEEKVGSSPYLSTEKNKINIGNKSEDTFEIQRARTSSGLGVGLNIKAGDAFGTDKAGGDLNLYGGSSTGGANGGSIRLYQAARSGSSDTLNSYSELFNTELTNSRINFTGIGTLGGISRVESNGNIVLSVDYDNNGSSDYFAIMDAAVTRLFMPTSSGGNMYLMSASNSTGLFLDAINSRISAGSQAAHGGTDVDTDNTGSPNATGKTLTLAGGAGTGSGAGGGISFGTYPAGSSGLTANSTYAAKMTMDKDGNLEIGGNLTVNGTTTTVNTATLDVEDKNITLNYHASSDTSGTADGAGITIQDAVDASTDATLLWTAASDTFTFSHSVNATLATAAQPNITSLGTLTALTVDNIIIDGDTIDASGDLALIARGNDITVDTDNFTIESATNYKPTFTLKTTHNGNKPPEINFVKDKGAAGAGGDIVSVISSIGDNDAQEQVYFAWQKVTVEDATDGAEEAKYVVGVRNADHSSPRDSLVLTGNGAATDATVGYGTGSVTTIAGTLTMGSTAFVNNSGVIQVATQGTIDHDSLANFVAAEHYRWDTDISGTATINAANIPTLNQSTTGNAATATALATARNINGVSFDGTGDITVTAAGSTLSDTVTVAKGGTGTTSYTDNQIVAYNAGTGKLEGHNVFITLPSANVHRLVIGDASNTVSSTLMSDNGAPLTVMVDFASGSNVAGSDLTLQAGVSTGTEAGGDIIFRSSPTGSSGSIPNTNDQIGKIDNVGNLTLDGGITVGASTSFVNSSGVVQVATQGTIDHDSLANFVAAEHVDWAGASAGTIHSTNIPTLNQDTTGQAGTVATIAGLAPNTATTAAAQPNITSLGTLTTLTVDDITINGDTITASADLNIVATGDDINVDTDNFTIENSGVNRPNFTLKNTHTGNKGQSFNFVKDKGAAGANGDSVGFITWTGDDDAQTQTGVASIHGSVESAAASNVEGKIEIGVAAIASGSGNNSTNVITGIGNGNTITDVTIGAGATGVTTIAGTLTIGSTAFVNNSGVIQVATQGTIDHDSLANFVANEHIDWTGSSAGTIHSTNIPTLNQDTTGNADTATALTSGDKTIAGDLTVTSGTSGDATLIISADTDNNDENDNSRLWFKQDGDITEGAVQMANNTLQIISNVSTSGGISFQTGTTDNTGTTDPSTGATERMSISNSGTVTVAASLQTNAIELEDAGDTTIRRSAAGKVTIEGNEIQTTNYHHHFLNAGFFMSFPFSRYIPLNGSINEQNTSTSSPEYTHFTWPYDGFVKKMMLRTETDMGSTELKLYKGASGAAVTTALGAVTETVAASNAVEFDFTSVSNTYSKGDTMAIRVDPTDDPDGGQNITIELVFDLTT